ncbi:MAG: thiamine diphosphokinase [Treponema sp.]|nr:thiamine diphosphokinase [Treponema sp.]
MHIVIFTGGDSPAPEECKAYLESHPADFIIAADSGLETLEKFASVLGKKHQPDAILGDMDSLSDSAMLARYPKSIIKTYPQDKDWSDTELALHLAVSTAKERHITLIGAAGGRIDHFLGVFDLFATDIRPDTWLTPVQALWYAGAGTSFSVGGLTKKDIVSLTRTSASRTGGRVTSDGLQWEWQLFRKEGMPSLSNRISEEADEAKRDVTVTVLEGAFVLILPLSARVTTKEVELNTKAPQEKVAQHPLG